MNIGAAVRVTRKARGWSQRELAERACIKQPNLSRIEAGLALPQPRTLERICGAFALSVEELHRRAGLLPAQANQHEMLELIRAVHRLFCAKVREGEELTRAEHFIFKRSIAVVGALEDVVAGVLREKELQNRRGVAAVDHPGVLPGAAGVLATALAEERTQ